MLSIGSSTGHDAYATTSQDDSRWEIRSRTDGSVLLQVPIQGAGDYALASLSVDGHWLATQTASGFRVYGVATGHSVTFGDDRDVSDYGWTPDGHLVGKRYPSQSSEVEVCDPATGDCVGTGMTFQPRAHARGRRYVRRLGRLRPPVRAARRTQPILLGRHLYL